MYKSSRPYVRKLQANRYHGVVKLVPPSNNPCTPREGDANSNNIIPLRSEKKTFVFSNLWLEKIEEGESIKTYF